MSKFEIIPYAPRPERFNVTRPAVSKGKPGNVTRVREGVDKLIAKLREGGR